MLTTPDLFRTTLPTKPPKSRKAQLGQFLTPATVSTFMASWFQPPFPRASRLLDAGAGAGALVEAFAQRWAQERLEGTTLAIDAYERDQVIQGALKDTLDLLQQITGVTSTVIDGDFTARAAEMIRLRKGSRYSHAILNPPYKKISTASPERAHFRAVGLETVNLYSGFVGLAVDLLEVGGELVAIIPRSFCNGPYYEPFRRFILDRAALQRIHLFGARDSAFSNDGVLQENVIIHMVRGAEQGEVAVSTSTDERFADLETSIYSFDRIVFPADQARFIHIPTGDDEELLRATTFGHTLDDIGIRVSTGPVVDFRVRDDLRPDPEPGTVPLLYPGHFTGETLHWPRADFKKSNAIRHTAATRKWLYPGGFYTVVRRFSSKEERRRVVASVVDPTGLPDGPLGFENHLNVFHEGRQPLPEPLARGLSVFLNATVTDRYFRRFNGHTQVNATDLRAMRYPSRAALTALGDWAIETSEPDQAAIDARVSCIT